MKNVLVIVNDPRLICCDTIYLRNRMKMTYVFPRLTAEYYASIIDRNKSGYIFFWGGGQKAKIKKNKDNLWLAHPKIY